MNLRTLSTLLLSLFFSALLDAQKNQDYFAVHAGELPVKVFYGLKAQPMGLLGVDSSKGIIFAKQGTAKVQLELRGLKRQNIKGFAYEWPTAQRLAMNNLANEQYDTRYLTSVRPIVYKLMRYLEIPFDYFPIHDDCLNYVQALLNMDQLNEAFYILARLNLVKLDDFGYREFSEASLDLAGKLIAQNPKSAKTARALLQRVQIRDDSGDHASYLRLANSLKDQGLYSEAITEYGRLAPIVSKSVDSPYKMTLKLWPIYCYIKLYETYNKYAARDPKYKEAAGKMFNTALQTMKKIDEKPPARQTNQYSLYKLIRSLIRVQFARQYEALGKERESAEYYRQSVLEVTEGIVSARVGLAWLPESLIMAAEAYENLELNDAARNVYKQVMIFYKSTKWEKQSAERLANLPPPA
jgi:tetratricopeptide (TPR) repeat protein